MKLSEVQTKVSEALPATVKLYLKGAVATCLGGGFTAAVVYFSDHNHYTLQAIKEAWGLILAGGTGALALYLYKTPIPQWRWEKAEENGEVIDRRFANGQGHEPSGTPPAPPE